MPQSQPQDLQSSTPGSHRWGQLYLRAPAQPLLPVAPGVPTEPWHMVPPVPKPQSQLLPEPHRDSNDPPGTLCIAKTNQNTHTQSPLSPLLCAGSQHPSEPSGRWLWQESLPTHTCWGTRWWHFCPHSHTGMGTGQEVALAAHVSWPEQQLLSSNKTNKKKYKSLWVYFVCFEGPQGTDLPSAFLLSPDYKHSLEKFPTLGSFLSGSPNSAAV